MNVVLLDTRGLHTAICKVSWTASSDESVMIEVCVDTPVADLPKSNAIAGVPGIIEGMALPLAVKQEAILQARLLAQEFLAVEI
jgi:hypothetical protein